MANNFRLLVEYDGTNYHGWQRQKHDMTIQGEIEKVISAMTRQPITLVGSGRTDAGVHALGQVANFKCETNLSADTFLRGLNSMLPADIVIKRCEPVDPQFHARYNVKNKTYQYKIWNSSPPPAIGRQYVWFIRRKLDVEAMRRAADCIVGEHDFKAFEGSGSPRAHTTRTVMKAAFRVDEDGGIVFDIQANGFLRYMVRNLVGTLVEVGIEKRVPGDIHEVIASKNRFMAGATAPAQGLFLVKVEY